MSLREQSVNSDGSLAELKAALALATRERDEALAQQAATAEVLKVISRSTFDLQAVLDTLLETACRLCAADIGTIRYEEGAGYRLAATFGCRPEWREHFAGYSSKPDRSSVFGQTILQGGTVHIPDVLEDADYARPVAQKLMGLRAALGVPLVREGRVFGAVNLFRTSPRSFTQRQIDLVETFADQAVIAIENARLFEAEQQRTAELSESLEQQTATSEILGVISRSPNDLQPVFDAIVQNAARLCDATNASVYRVEENSLRHVANYGGVAVIKTGESRPISAASLSGKAVIGRKIIHVHDGLAVADTEFADSREAIKREKIRTALAVPLMRGDKALGVMVVRRDVVRDFTDKQIDLLKTFADQAVIAIENVRLFADLRQRTDDLSEALEQQTATSEVLRVISNSPGTLEPVFQAMLENATRICEAKIGILWAFEDGAYKAVSMLGVSPEYADYLNRGPIRAGPTTGLGRVASTKQTIHIVDTLAEQAYAERDPFRIATAELGGARSLLNVPMIKDGELVGAIGIYRQEVRPFTDKQVELVTNFAAQAVIAIENTRLLNELRELLEQQTATSEVLQVISASPGELQPVFQVMLANAVRICDAKLGTLFLAEDDSFRTAALYGAPPAFAEARSRNPMLKAEPGTGLGRVVAAKKAIQIADIQQEPAYTGNPSRASLLKVVGARSLMNVPMLKDGKLIGVIGIYRQEVRPFTEKQIELVTNFAAQAVIAIENTRLLNELRESLEQQTATSEVLSVISSSPGALDPVFQAMLENAVRICGAKFGNLWLREGDNFRIGASYGGPQAYLDFLKGEQVFHPESTTGGLGALLETKKIFHIADVTAAPAPGDKLRQATIELAGARTLIGVPLLKDGEVVGAIGIDRQEVRPFTDKQIALVKNFAAQAVIAIENTRLLNELRIAPAI